MHVGIYIGRVGGAVRNGARGGEHAGCKQACAEGDGGVMRYTYQCKAEGCGCRFDRDFRFAQQPEEVECPVCQGRAGRLITSVPIQFRGSGWAGSRHGMHPDRKPKDGVEADFHREYAGQ